MSEPYRCNSAERVDRRRWQQADTTLVTAWFAPDMPVPAGPEFKGQLPGLILELNMNNGRVVYHALEISTKVNPASIKEPKGKRITAAEFNKARDKEMEEMRRNMPRRDANKTNQLNYRRLDKNLGG